MKFFYKKIIIILLFYIIFTNYFKGYYFYYPSIPVYTNNKKELEIVKNKMRNRSSEDVSFFYKTNKFLHIMLISLVKRAHGTYDHVKDVLMRLDYNRYYDDS